jgi:two-component system, chemotaxis family, CheB/CheR fusion protein
VSEPLPPAFQLRALVVDDHADAAGSLSLLIVLWGHECRTARDGPAALAVASEFRPDVVLLDIGLPRMDGFEFGRRLRAMPGLESVVLVALTGHVGGEYRQRAAEAGCSFYMVKPANLGELETLLQAMAREKVKPPLR